VAVLQRGGTWQRLKTRSSRRLRKKTGTWGGEEEKRSRRVYGHNSTGRDLVLESVRRTRIVPVKKKARRANKTGTFLGGCGKGFRKVATILGIRGSRGCPLIAKKDRSGEQEVCRLKKKKKPTLKIAIGGSPRKITKIGFRLVKPR